MALCAVEVGVVMPAGGNDSVLRTREASRLEQRASLRFRGGAPASLARRAKEFDSSGREKEFAMPTLEFEGDWLDDFDDVHLDDVDDEALLEAFEQEDDSDDFE